MTLQRGVINIATALSLYPECEKLHYPRPHRYARIATLGGSTIARLVLEHLPRGELPGTEVMGIDGRGPDSRGAALVVAFGVPFAVDASALLALKPPAVLEANSQDAVCTQLVRTLAAGVSVIALSAGALTDDCLQEDAEAAAAKSGAVLSLCAFLRNPRAERPQRTCAAGVGEVSI